MSEIKVGSKVRIKKDVWAPWFELPENEILTVVGCCRSKYPENEFIEIETECGRPIRFSLELFELVDGE